MAWAQDRASWLAKVPAFSWAGAVVVALLLMLAYPTELSLVSSWQNHPDYSHGWLVLPAAAWILVRAKPWVVNGAPLVWLGTVTMLAGGILHLAVQVLPWPLLDYAGWCLLLRGLTLSLWGREAARRVMPVLAFAVMMFPWPTVWLNTLAMQLQNLIAIIAEAVLNLIWVCHRRGHLLYLAGLEEPLSVAVECSGVRQLLVFIALGWFLAFFVRGAWWRRVALVAASVPLAILANVLRVFVLAMTARLLGPSSIQGLLHDVPLLMTLPLGGLLLWWCYCRLNDSQGRESVELTPLQASMVSVSTRKPWHPPSGFLLYGVLVLLVALQMSLQWHLHRSVREPSIATFSFKELPWQLGVWKGQLHPESEKIKRQADFAEAVTVRAYTDSQGRAVAVYLVFSATGRDRLHYPEICLRDAGGAVELKHDRLTVPLQIGTTKYAERFRYQRQRHERSVVYYWHYTFVPPITEQQSLLQRLYLKQHEDWPGITVQVQTNISDPAAWKTIETTLLPEIDRWVSAHVPAGVEVGAGRLPVRYSHER